MRSLIQFIETRGLASVLIVNKILNNFTKCLKIFWTLTRIIFLFYIHITECNFCIKGEINRLKGSMI